MSSDNAGRMISGDVWDLSFHDISLTVEEKLRNKSQPGKLIRPGIECGSTRREATILHIFYSGDQSGFELCGL